MLIVKILKKNLKYIIVISMFSEHITIFRSLSIDIWQLKCQQRQTNKTKNGELFFWKLFRIIKFVFLILWEKPFWNQMLLLPTATARCSCSNIKLCSIFSPTLLKLIFATKIKTILLKQSAVQNNIMYIMCMNT